jgi:5-methylcytosine-specific restriction endonuclease McrA
MDKSLNDLNKFEQSFIDTVYIQCKTFAEAERLLDIDRAKIRQLNKDLEPFWRPITKIRDKWKTKKIGGNFWDFYNWYKSADKSCHYCKITQEQIDKLHILGLNNKRITRGRTLEIDRKIAEESYSNITNLTYSCYWCNNAKTDTFTEEEFKIIGLAIGTIWKQRLNI